MRVPILNLEGKAKEKILRNRLAAQNAFVKKKAHVLELEKQNAFLISQNKMLMERLMALEKYVYNKINNEQNINNVKQGKDTYVESKKHSQDESSNTFSVHSTAQLS